MRSNLVIKNQNMFNGSIKDSNAPYSVVELKKDIDLDYCEGYVAFINNIFDNMTEDVKKYFIMNILQLANLTGGYLNIQKAHYID